MMSELKKILITGSTDGIGLATARKLFMMGHQVFIPGRTEEKARVACGQVLLFSGKKLGEEDHNVVPVWGDLSHFKEVVMLANQVKKLAPDLDVLINNAGVFATEKQITTDGFELTFAVNHLATHLLTHHLLPVLKQKPSSRVVTLSSIAHSRGHLHFDNLNCEKSFEGYNAYSATKLMNMLFTRCLAALSKNTGPSANALHPGVIDTKLLRAGFNISGEGVDKGSETSVFLATDPKVIGVTGKYFVNCRQTIPSLTAQDDNLAVQLWKKTEEILKPWY